MPSCSVKWCSNHTSTCSLKSKNGVSFHRFPKDESTCQKWVEAIRFERRDPWWTSSNASRVCSIHFRESDISSTPCKVNILAKTAVPVCTMVWYEDNENNVTPEICHEKTNTDKIILKTYERKKSAINVLKESKIIINKLNIEGNTLSKTNETQLANITPYPQVKAPQEFDTKILKTLEISRTQNLKKCQESNTDKNRNIQTSTTANRNEVQKKAVLTELNKTENDKPHKEKCSQSKILVKLNENTSLILDEDLSNDLDPKFEDPTKVSEESITRTCVFSKKLTNKETKSNENEEPKKGIIKKTNTDMFLEIIKNGNVELNSNISNSFVGKMLKTYMPKRNRINEKNTRRTFKDLRKNKNVWSATSNITNKGLNTFKCKDVKNIKVNIYPRNDISKMVTTTICIKNKIKADLKSNTISQDKKEIPSFINVKKNTFKRRSNQFDRPREKNGQTVDREPNMEINKKSIIVDIDELITNPSILDNKKETDTVIDEIISEFFENPKNVGNVSDISSNYQKSNENKCVESIMSLPMDKNMNSAFDKGNDNVILDLDTNIYTELNSFMDLEICSELNIGLNDETNTEVYTDKAAVNESFTQIKENIETESNQQVSITNKDMSMEHDHLVSESHYCLNSVIDENVTTPCEGNMDSNKNITNNVIILSNNLLRNSQTSIVNNIVTESNKFTELKKLLSTKPKLDSFAEVCTNTLADIDNNICPKYDNIKSMITATENLRVPERNHVIELDKCLDIVVNNMVTSLPNNINTDVTKKKESNATGSEQFNSVLIEEIVTNKESKNSENMDFINNFINPNTIRELELNTDNISDIIVERNKYLERDMPELNTIMNSEFCNEANIALNDKMNTPKTSINEDTQFSENTMTKTNQQVSIMNKNIPMEYSDHFISLNKNMPKEHNDHSISESNHYLNSVINENIVTQCDANIVYNENIINNVIILSNNILQNVGTSAVNNIVTETEENEYVELKKHLSTNPKLESLAGLCTHTLADNNIKSMAINKENLQFSDRNNTTEFDTNMDIVVSNMFTSLQNNINTTINTDVTPLKQFNSILLEEFITNKSAELKDCENENFINNFNTDPTTREPEFNKKFITDSNIEHKKNPGKDMPELNTFFLTELNEDQLISSKADTKRKCNHLHTEMFTDQDLLLRKYNKDFENVLPISDDQQIIVNKHMDVVDSILNRDRTEEFDLSLLLSDTPIPDEDIQNVDNNTNNNSLDGIEGSPNWIQLPTDDMPKIIDDLLDQDSPFFENMDLFVKDSKLNLDKETNRRDNEIKTAIKETSNSNFEQFEEQIINNFCETVEKCTKNSIAQIQKHLIADFSDNNGTGAVQSNIIYKLNKDIQFNKVTAEKYYNLCDEDTGKEIQEQFLQTNKNQSDSFKLGKILDECYEHNNKEIQGCKTKSQTQNNIDSKANQIKDVSIDQYFVPSLEQSGESYREHGDRLGIDNLNDEVLNSEAILQMSKKQYDKQSNDETYLIGITQDESVPNLKIQNEYNFKSTFQELGKKLSEDLNEKKIEVNDISEKTHTTGIKIGNEQNFQKLKRVLFEECYDPECGSDCKNKKHNSDTELHKKDVQRYKDPNNYTPCESDITKRNTRCDLFHERQCDQSSIDNFEKQLTQGSFDPNNKQNNKRLLDKHKLSHNENCKTKYKKIAIDLASGQYLELRWQQCARESNISSQEECKRQLNEIGLEQKKLHCNKSEQEYPIKRNVDQSDNNSENENSNIYQHIMTECPECGYTDNDIINYKSDVDLRITKPLSLINKDMLLSLQDNEDNKRVSLESVYAMELAYVTAIQALERKLKQKIAISEYRLRRVNKLSKINNRLLKANNLMDIADENKI